MWGKIKEVCKSVASSTATGLIEAGKFAVVGGILVGKVGSAAGGAFLTTQKKALQYFLGRDDHPIAPYVSWGTIIGITIFMIGTRGHAIKKRIMGSSQPKTNSEPEELDCKGKSIYIPLRITTTLSLLFATLNGYAGAIALLKFLIENFSNADPEEQPWYLIHLIALFVASTNLATSQIFSQPTTNRNARHLAATRSLPMNTSSLLTGVLTVTGTLGMPALNWRATNASMEEIFSKLNWDEKYKLFNIFAGASSITGPAAGIFTNIRTVYETIINKKEYTFTNVKWWETPFKYTMWFTGSIEGLITALSYFISLVLLAQKWTDIDSKNPAVMVPSALIATASFFLNFVFSVKRGTEEVIKDSHRANNTIYEQTLASDIDNPEEGYTFELTSSRDSSEEISDEEFIDEDSEAIQMTNFRDDADTSSQSRGLLGNNPSALFHLRRSSNADQETISEIDALPFTLGQSFGG